MAKQTNKVILSRFTRMPVFNRPTALNADNTPRVITTSVANPLARKPRNFLG